MLNTSSQLIQQLNVSDLNGTNGFTISSTEFFANLGWYASSAGDINGDGFDDLILGAPSNSYASLVTYEPVEGKAYVVFGQATGFPTNLDVSILNGNNGFVISGMSPGFYSGLPVSSAGDINGDGFDDLLFADPSYYETSYVVFGQADGFPVNLNVSNLDGNNGFAINGLNSEVDSVSSAGDINGDGFDDMIIGLDFSLSSDKGYVVFGSAEGFSAALNVSTLDGSNGFVINGINTGNFSSSSVSSAGDVNGDRLDDIVISTGANHYVVFGKTEGFSASLDLFSLNDNNGFVINSSGTPSSAGDVNGDGIDDIIIGNPNADPNGVNNAGSSYVIFGQAGGFDATLDPSTLNGNNGFVINGINANDRLGDSVSSAGDVNGDGFDDLIIKSSLPNSFKDVSYVVFGASGGFSPTLNLSALNGTNGFVINGFSDFRSSVSAAGDVNGDGFDDLLIGSPYAGYAGESYVIFGSDFTGQVTAAGTPDDDVLIGTTGADIMIGDLGNDLLLTRGGSDVVKGGAGDDTLTVRDLSFRQLDGGSGIDTLRLTGWGLNLNLTTIADNKITGIEKINLSGTGNHQLTLDVLDVLALSDTTNQLIVQGSVGDTVSSTGQGWLFDGTTNLDGIVYNQYTSGAASLLVSSQIAQTIT
jgi:hypothetical protein